jgi:molybdopterin-guanine dinucleotide biosynthesis protein A
MTSRICILSQPVQTGKTTLLMRWISTYSSIGGILTPDVNGKRMLFDIARNTYHPFQLENGEAGIRIGRFVFDSNVFEQARNILSQSASDQYSWVIVDEIGKLELHHHSGLEPALGELIRHFQQHHTTGNLLLVIRDHLLNEAIAYYGLQDATILSRDYFTGQVKADMQYHAQNLCGLVLCGGQSVRMGTDKAFITYHDKPQYLHMADMLHNVCEEVRISCNSSQQSNLSTEYKQIPDSATFADAGPMTGLLSAAEAFHGRSFLVTGCDYPSFTQQDMMALIQARAPQQYDAVCFKHPGSGFNEPLLAIYEHSCIPEMQHAYRKGQTSLRHFLSTIRTCELTPRDPLILRSIDTPGATE